MAYLANLIKQNSESEKIAQPKRYFGCAKCKLHYPIDIDFCNDEIASMFGVDE